MSQLQPFFYAAALTAQLIQHSSYSLRHIIIFPQTPSPVSQLQPFFTLQLLQHSSYSLRYIIIFPQTPSPVPQLQPFSRCSSYSTALTAQLIQPALCHHITTYTLNCVTIAALFLRCSSYSTAHTAQLIQPALYFIIIPQTPSPVPHLQPFFTLQLLQHSSYSTAHTACVISSYYH